MFFRVGLGVLRGVLVKIKNLSILAVVFCFQAIFADIYQASQWIDSENRVVTIYHDYHSLFFQRINKMDEQFEYMKSVFERVVDSRIQLLVESFEFSREVRILREDLPKKDTLNFKLAELFEKTISRYIGVDFHNVEKRVIFSLFYNLFSTGNWSNFQRTPDDDQFLDGLSEKTLLGLFLILARDIFAEERLNNIKNILCASYKNLENRLIASGLSVDVIRNRSIVSIYTDIASYEQREEIKNLFSNNSIMMNLARVIDGNCLLKILNSEPETQIVVVVGARHAKDLENELPGLGFTKKRELFSRWADDSTLKVDRIPSNERARYVLPISNEVFDWLLE